MQQPVKHIGCRWSHGGFTSSLHVHPVMSQQIYILAALHIAPSAVGVLFDWSVLALEALCLLTLSVKGVKKRSCMLLSLTSFAMFWLSDLHPAKVFVNKVSTSDHSKRLWSDAPTQRCLFGEKKNDFKNNSLGYYWRRFINLRSD